MGNYDFEKDFKIALSTEQEAVSLLKLIYEKCTFIRFNDDYRYDIVMKIGAGLVTYEVKEDFMCEHTGNVSLEYESRGKLSGISVSEADYYIYKLHISRTEIIFAIISSDILKEYIADKAFFRIVNGGDKGSNTLNYLFKYEKFIRKASLYKLYKP